MGKVDPGFEDRSERAERIEAFCASPLAVTLLQVARGDVVEACVARDIRGDIVVRTQPLAAAPDNYGQLSFEVDSLRNRRQNDRLFRGDDGGGRLEENQRLFRRFVAQL